MRDTLVLFDLDGTVLTFTEASVSPSRHAMNAAIQELFGIENASQGIAFAGATDRAIVRTILEQTAPQNGSTFDAIVSHVFNRYLHFLEKILVIQKYEALGPIAETITTLQEQQFCIGIGTGNIRMGAAMKLRSANLLKYFSLECGGYGCDNELRSQVLRIAIQRCEKYYQKSFRRIVVVGDTQYDIHAAKQVDALAIGVASSISKQQELAQHGADYVVPRCSSELVSLLSEIESL